MPETIYSKGVADIFVWKSCLQEMQSLDLKDIERIEKGQLLLMLYENVQNKWVGLAVANTGPDCDYHANRVIYDLPQAQDTQWCSTI